MTEAILVLFLLLPVAAFSGWLAGRRSASRPNEVSQSELPTQYITGLNYLLNEQQDKAIDLFIQMLEVDSETVETHLALGSLFRRRGEVDRAIRIHQNLIARPTLSQSQRAQALYELGHDYMRAGLFDRAETLFSELIESGPHTEPALRQLIDIYQQEKDWDKAIETAHQLENKTGASLHRVIAQYYCELAEHHLRQGETSKAMRLLRRALNTDKACVRASLMEGDIERKSGDYKSAIRAYRRVEDQDPAYLPEVLEPLSQCYTALGRKEDMDQYLRELLARHEGISVMLTRAEQIRREEGDEVAADFITDFLRKRPSVRGMDRLIDLNLDHVNDSVRDKLLTLKEVTTQLLVNNPVYKCEVCGFTGKTLHWQCPGCKGWNTIKPIQGVEGE